GCSSPYRTGCTRRLRRRRSSWVPRVRRYGAVFRAPRGRAPVDGTYRTVPRKRGRRGDTSSLPPCRPSRVLFGTPSRSLLHSSFVTFLRQCRCVLPRRQDRSAGDAEPEETPHPRDVDPRQDDRPASSLDLARGGVQVLHPHVIHASRDLLRLAGTDPAAPP